MAASVGAAGMNDRYRGWSTDRQAGASTSAKTRSASAPPSPSGVMVWPASASSASAERGWSSGGGSSRVRSTA